jgi:2-polyprenyl-3-methyl-5-hydroxy-6-metoxy-1,4-benzoquinol methylase
MDTSPRPLGADSFAREDCPICSGPIALWRIKRACGTDYRIDRCRTCGYAFVNPRPSLRFLKALYASAGHDPLGASPAPNLASILTDEAYDPGTTLDARRMLETVTSLVGDGSGRAFLDIGCGYGFFAREALRAGFDVTALEMADRERAVASGLTAQRPVPCPFEEFERPAGSFSVVLMSQVLEHAFDVGGWVGRASRLLAPGGIVAVALPNFGSLFRRLLQEREPYVMPPMHLNHFSPNNLVRLLAKHALEVEVVQHVSRIPRRSWDRRLPGPFRRLSPIAHRFATLPLRLIDGLGLGMMINVYGRKRDPR